MTTILMPTSEHAVAARDGLWMSPADAERATGWTLKPCRTASWEIITTLSCEPGKRTCHA